MIAFYTVPGVSSQWELPKREFKGFKGNRDQWWVESKCWNIDLLEDLAQSHYDCNANLNFFYLHHVLDKWNLMAG